MGVVKLTLDKGVTTTAIGHVYGLDFEIEDDGYRVQIFFDYYNRRLKIVDYEATDYRAMVKRMNWLAKANGFDKIFLKATKDDWQVFLTFGYVLEGIMRHCFQGEDAFVMSKFRTLARISSPHLIEESDLIERLMAKPRDSDLPPLPEGYRMELARTEHIPGLVTLYRRVFETYPSPLTHPDFIHHTMCRNILYRVILNPDGDVVSAASADMDAKHSNAELTDCATLDSERGKGLMLHLLRRLEDDLRERKVVTGYTLARAMSLGMNRVFYRLGYEYSGRLVNNCDIYGSFEDLNIWVKRLDRE
jgi:putative beta-lysine N-acetyltransferase